MQKFIHFWLGVSTALLMVGPALGQPEPDGVIPLFDAPDIAQLIEDDLFGHPATYLARPYPIMIDRNTLRRFNFEGTIFSLDFIPTTADGSAVALLLSVIEHGKTVFITRLSETGSTSGRAELLFVQLGPGTRFPQLVIAYHEDGGARCCTRTVVLDMAGERWTILDLPYQYGELRFQPATIGLHGGFVLIGADSDVLASAPQAHPIPIHAYSLTDGKWRDAHQDRTLADFYGAQLAWLDRASPSVRLTGDTKHFAQTRRILEELFRGF